jgi:sugar phosphate isomerase/epimerase
MKRRLLLSIDDRHSGRIDEVVEQLRLHGMDVTSVQPTLGTVTGEIDEERQESLGGIEGVEAVERAGEIQLPPPESEIQ